MTCHFNASARAVSRLVTRTPVWKEVRQGVPFDVADAYDGFQALVRAVTGFNEAWKFSFFVAEFTLIMAFVAFFVGLFDIMHLNSAIECLRGVLQIGFPVILVFYIFGLYYS